MLMQTDYDVIVIGGGLAGLAASIQLGRKGYAVALLEKEQYPFHKVCGEYVSLECWDFLESLGVPLKEFQLPIINTLHLTAPNGKQLFAKLPLGGFGISRYKLDAVLADIAVENGVHLLQQTKVNDLEFNNGYTVHSSKGILKSKVCCAAYGKRSNLDVKLNRGFLQDPNQRLHNYVGIKYHVETEGQENVIGLHNFKKGYCGISKIETGKYCLCYMTAAENLKSCNNNIEEMQEKVLFQNPHLKQIFLKSKIVPGFPVTISQISFSKKTKAENGMLMLGDAAGMITPLCGNGMSIALHTSKIAATLIEAFLKSQMCHSHLAAAYEDQWKKNFAARLKTGRVVQGFFGSNSLSNLLVSTFRTFPFLARPLIRLTHGKPF